MDKISISMAMTMALTEWSESTIRRKIADGSVTREFEPGPNGRSMIHVDSIRGYITLPLAESDLSTIRKADSGDVEAQNDLALLFLANDRVKAAIYWLELAVKQNHPDAMHWLARCYLKGNGLPKDENIGIMWLSKAASLGHVISQVQMDAIRNSFIEKNN